MLCVCVLMEFASLMGCMITYVSVRHCLQFLSKTLLHRLSRLKLTFFHGHSDRLDGRDWQ